MAAVTISCGKLVLSFEQDERQWHSNLTDGGQSWGEAALQQPVLSKAFTRFSMPWRWNGGPAVLRSRAWDDDGNAQPTRAERRHSKCHHHLSLGPTR